MSQKYRVIDGRQLNQGYLRLVSPRPLMPINEGEADHLVVETAREDYVVVKDFGDGTYLVEEPE